MTSGPGVPTLDQLNVLIQIVEAGSFTTAAKRLNRALSVVSYTVNSLEAQLGITLFDRTSSRRPRLTAAGRMVLAGARSIRGGVERLRAKVAGISRGLEVELHVAIDSLMSTARITDAVKGLSDTFPTVVLHLHVETLGAVVKLVLDGKATLGVSGRRSAEFDEIRRIGAGSLRMVPVAAPQHPLASDDGNLFGEARDHLQLVVYDRSPLTQGTDYSVVASRTWRLADLNAKHMLLRSGLGWGVLPLAMVKSDLDDGALVELKVPELPPFDYHLDIVHRNDCPPGPAASWLIERVRAQPSD